jgi:hypothetical protein
MVDVTSVPSKPLCGEIGQCDGLNTSMHAVRAKVRLLTDISGAFARLAL